MALEIERKFLVCGDAWREHAQGVLLRQGYLQTTPCTVRVRIEGEQGLLTIKGMTEGITRSEYEYAIPYADAQTLLDTLAQRPLISKIRYSIPYQEHTWVVDVFLEENAGLILAEVELAEQDEAIILPPWVGQEVSHDPRYRNSSLVVCPFSTWDESSTAS